MEYKKVKYINFEKALWAFLSYRLIEHNIWQYILPYIYGMSKIPQLCLTSKIVSMFMHLIPTSKQNDIKSKPLIKLYRP